MFTRTAKIGYILAYCGIAVLALPVVMALAGKLDGYYAGVLAIGAIMLALGFVLLRKDQAARSRGWRVLWAKVLPTIPNEIGLILAFFGALMTPIALSNVQASRWREFDLLFLVAVLEFLVSGWFLALGDSRRSRSPQK
jgi:hypothetical protein